jgi:hypothetical protein
MKISKVVKCLFTNEWVNPANKIVYYHQITLENGDVGTVGSMEKYPSKITEGAKIQYVIENGKIKIEESMDKPQKQFQNYQAKSNTNKHDSFLGYAWSYAKDLVIAGKTSDDYDEVRRIAHLIYYEIGEMLENNSKH